MAIHRRLDSFSLIFTCCSFCGSKTELHQNLPPITSGFQLLRSLSANKHFCRTSRAVEILYLSWFFLVDPIISPSPVPATAILKFFIIFTPPVFLGPNSLKRCFYLCTHPEGWYFLPIVFFLPLNLLHGTTTSLYTDCNNNLYAGLSSYLLILFSALSAFAVMG